VILKLYLKRGFNNPLLHSPEKMKDLKES